LGGISAQRGRGSLEWPLTIYLFLVCETFFIHHGFLIQFLPSNIYCIRAVLFTRPASSDVHA
jgi:hypothetical protein